MKNTIKDLTAREKKAIFNVIDNGLVQGLEKKNIVKRVCEKMVSLGIVKNGGCYNAMLSVALAFYAMKKAQIEKMDIYNYIRYYSNYKYHAMIKLNDYGAFGDFIECVARIINKPKNLIKYNDIHVKQSGSVDITIKKIRCECGTNGKTFLESTENNPMNGKYNNVLYGVFSNDDKKALFSLAIKGDFSRLFDNVASMLYMFNKDSFFECLTTKCGRGSMFKFKGEKWQVVYNDSKYNAFLKMVENENIPTLKDFLIK